MYMWRKNLRNIFWATVLVLLIGLNTTHAHSAILGWFSFVLYLWVLSGFARTVLVKLFHLFDKFTTRIIGALFLIFTLGSLGGAVIFFHHFNSVIFVTVLWLNAILWIILGNWAGESKDEERIEAPEKPAVEQIPNISWVVIIFLVAIINLIDLLLDSRTGAGLLSPWQTIRPEYIYLFAFTTFLLGLTIFSRLHARSVLLLLIIYSVCLHAYLPLSHQLFYGADGWRHLASESRIVSGLNVDITPVVTPSTTPFFLTSAPGNLFYSQFWALGVWFSTWLHSDLIKLMIWLVPILWGIAFPILAYNIGLRLFSNKRLVLFFVFLTALPFALQVSGSYTLPSNLSLLFFILGLLLILARADCSHFEQIIVLGIFSVFSVFGYGLYLLLFILAWMLFEILGFNFSARWRIPFLALLGILSALFFPVVEFFAKYIAIPAHFNFISSVKQALGTLAGYFLATGPTDRAITIGNILFNQTSKSVFVSNLFTAQLWWVVPVAIIFWSFVFFGLIFILANSDRRWRLFGFLSLAVFIGYKVDRYLFTGPTLLTRRLDALFALLALLCVFMLVYKIINSHLLPIKLIYRQILILVIIALSSFAIAGSYSLGPNLPVLSVDEYRAMQFVWNKEHGSTSTCVLADTYPLLALEYLSQKNIVGGGFPMGQDFSQLERVNLYNAMLADARSEIWSASKDLTKADHCYFIAPKKEMKINNFSFAANSSGKMFGSYVVWEN